MQISFKHIVNITRETKQHNWQQGRLESFLPGEKRSPSMAPRIQVGKPVIGNNRPLIPENLGRLRRSPCPPEDTENYAN